MEVRDGAPNLTAFQPAVAMQGHRGVTKVVCLLAYCNPHDFNGLPITRFGDARLYGLGVLGRIPLVLRILKITQLHGGDPPLPSEEEQFGSLQKVADVVGVKSGTRDMLLAEGGEPSG